MTRTLARHLTAPDEVARIAAKARAIEHICACGEPTPRVFASFDDLTTVGKMVLIECKNPNCYAPTKVKILKPA